VRKGFTSSLGVSIAISRTASRAVGASQRVASLAAPVVLVLAGIFIFGMLLVGGMLVVPAVMSLAWLMLEFAEGVSVELLRLF
jgi:hypothetical protein